MTKQIKSKKTSKTQSVKELAASLREIADEWAGTPVHCDYQNHPLRPLMLEAYHSALATDPCCIRSAIVESVNKWGGQHFEATSKRIEPPDNETGLRSLRLQKAAIVLLNMLERLKRQDYGDKGESAELRQIADALEGKTAEPEPLTEQAAIVLDMLKALPPDRAMLGPKILDALAKREPPIYLDQGVLTGRIIPALESHGVKNKPKVGYYLAKKKS